MRSAFALACFAALPLAAQQNDPLAFLRRDGTMNDRSVQEYRAPLYRPVRSGEVRSAGFLTELRRMPYGRVLGPAAPPVMHNTESPETALPWTVIGITPPAGAAYQSGDTVMLARLVAGPPGWGDIVVPTGLARVSEHTPRQTLATIIAMYGPVRMGQVVLPLEPVANPGAVQPVTVSGPSGRVIVGREVRELEQVGGILFIDVGRGAGLRLGDFVEVRRRPGQRINAADTGGDLLAVAQVVRVGDKSSTIKLIRVIDPDIRAGAPVVRIATLPG